ncbi:MAG: hypothetical protein P9M07_08020 [Candidatus Aceula meridiana]|nr:hypothetical protein [Candidatus Aceula meridiana]
MKHSFETGISFGLTSGIITTLGLIVGLYAGTRSKAVVIGGILTIAIADALSDALGIHISEEAEAKHTPREIWEATIATFIVKLVVSSLFIFPVIFLPTAMAVGLSVIAGFLAIASFSCYIARKDGSSTVHAILEHLIVAAVVVIATYYVGSWIAKVFQ